MNGKSQIALEFVFVAGIFFILVGYLHLQKFDSSFTKILEVNQQADGLLINPETGLAARTKYEVLDHVIENKSGESWNIVKLGDAIPEQNDYCVRRIGISNSRWVVLQVCG